VRITANQVTFARLVAMPAVATLLYTTRTGMLVALVIGLVVGVTDLLDGWLARRQGPTVLGGLMDPVADKVFVATAFLPFVDLGWAPWWPVALLFLREFIVTAVRSSFEVRQKTLKTTYFAKIKAWVQMAGVGVLFLMPLVSRTGMLIFLGICIAIAVIAAVIVLGILKKRWPGVWYFLGFFVSGTILFAVGGEAYLKWTLLAAIVGVTWASGLDYILGGLPLLLRGTAFDVVRLAGAAALPPLALLSFTQGQIPVGIVLAVVALELAHGGLDNLLAHHGAAAPAWQWGLRVGAICVFLGASLLWPEGSVLFGCGALGATLVGTFFAFFRNRRFYLEEKLREKKRKELAGAST
jgi:CDP-diacylglycerol--glycerol-3-phosphate 3-phosphatidyltransferase